MARRERRTDQDLVKELIEYLKEATGTVSRGKLCKALGINPDTAEKWLEIGILFRKECPAFEYNKADHLGIISLA